jgi:radical SAM protein with 4Fe4S-binding SPASM domain
VVDSITFSFHGGTPEAYNLNTGLDFDTVYNNIVNFAHANPGIITHIYCLHWSTTKDTETEFMKLWEGVDVDSVTVRASMEWGGDREDECTVSAETKGREDVHRIPCPRVLYQVDVMVDGTVPLCCVDGHGKVAFGNLNEESIVEMWHSDKRIYYREMHESLQFDKLELCADCSVNIRDGRK